jgi:hypothetical protein
MVLLMHYGPKLNVGEGAPDDGETCRVWFQDGSFDRAVWVDEKWWATWGCEVDPVAWQRLRDPAPGHPTLFDFEADPYPYPGPEGEDEHEANTEADTETEPLPDSGAEDLEDGGRPWWQPDGETCDDTPEPDFMEDDPLDLDLDLDRDVDREPETARASTSAATAAGH